MPSPELTSKPDCCPKPQPASQRGCPQGKPSPASHVMVLLCFLWLLAIQDICVYSVTHNRGLFSLEGLHHCLSPGAYHVSTYLIFFPPGRSARCYFQHPPCARGNSYFGTHGKDCGNISCYSKERFLSLTKKTSQRFKDPRCNVAGYPLAWKKKSFLPLTPYQLIENSPRLNPIIILLE